MINWRKPLVFFLLHITGSRVPENLQKIRSLDVLTLHEQQKHQAEKLREILLYAYLHVPYYRKVLRKAGVVDEQQNIHLSHFSKIPILTKDIIRREGKKLYSDRRTTRKAYKNTSGGSTGKPAIFLQDKAYWELNGIAAKLFFHEIFGKQIGDPEINLWGSERDILHNSLGFKERLMNFLYNRTFLNAFVVSEKKLHDFVQQINQKKPVSMWVYVESIDLLSRYIEENNLKIHQPKYIISTAGVLYPEMRARIEKVFGCPVYNQYGSREVGPIAVECVEQNGLHTFPYLHYIENIDNEIVITLLTNYSMPLIRYKIGDTGEFNKKLSCTCGRTFKQLNAVTGRQISHFVNSSGKIIHGQYFIHQFYFLEWIEQFKVIQEEQNKIICLIVKRGKARQADLNKIRFHIKFVMGANCTVVFKFVRQIKPSASGKYLYTESKLKLG